LQFWREQKERTTKEERRQTSKQQFTKNPNFVKRENTDYPFFFCNRPTVKKL